MRTLKVEILYFDGCPHWVGARELVAEAAREAGVAPDIELVRVADESEAARLRFLGSPTVRVDGRDVEPGADAREDYVLACRVYRSPAGMSGLPPFEWVRRALTE